jgi:hypothetical protein
MFLAAPTANSKKGGKDLGNKYDIHPARPLKIGAARFGSIDRVFTNREHDDAELARCSRVP